MSEEAKTDLKDRLKPRSGDNEGFRQILFAWLFQFNEKYFNIQKTPL